MSGSFTISLLEIIAYLFPGGLLLAAILYVFLPDLGRKTLEEAVYQIIFVACSYIAGHLLMLASYALSWLRERLRKSVRGKLLILLTGAGPIEQHLFFYENLREKLKALFCGDFIRNDDVYHFSYRLITDKKLPTSQLVDRLYALMLFSRNIAVSFIVTAVIFSFLSPIVGGGLFFLAAVFFIRFVYIEKVMVDTVVRSAYLYLCSSGGKEEPEDDAESRRE
jgi:hypothetical protein